MDSPDRFEQTAHALELDQHKRYKKSKEKDTFFEDSEEAAVFESIKEQRRLSKTYHPDNAR